MAFSKVERSYHSTRNGYRLATFEEASNGLETIKKEKLLNRWDRVRLLDGWITGPGYNFEMGNDFKGCLGYMLLIQTKASDGAYADVNLSERRKEVALFLCVDDWNYEVLYSLLNSWSNSQTMKVGEVREGNIPLRDSSLTKFREMNKMMGYVARRLGEQVGAALEKAGQTKYSGKDSVEEVLSGMIKILIEDMNIMQVMGTAILKLAWYQGDEYCLPDSATTGDVEEPFWSFVCDSFAGNVVELCAFTSLKDLCKMMTKSTSQNNFMIATIILLHLSDFRTDIIHEPMAHNCKGSCAKKILSYAAKKAAAAGNPLKFNEMLKNNAMWRCYDDTDNYGVLHKLLISVAKIHYKDIEQGEKIAKIIVDMLLQCGAQPGKPYAIGKYKNKTVLHSIAKFRDEDVGTAIAETLLRGYKKQSINEFVNAADERGRTALHSASEKGNARICGLLVDHGALVEAKDGKGMTALHYALEGGFYKAIDAGTEVAKALLRRCDRQSIDEFVNAADDKGRTALHSAAKKGNTHICGLLVNNGALVNTRDREGMTALHYALEGRIDSVIDVLLESPHVTESLDLKGKRKYTPFDIALANEDYGSTAKMLLKSEEPPEAYLDKALPYIDNESTAKLLSKLEEPEAYFNKVDQEQLLRNSLLLGSVDIVDNLFRKGIRLPNGDCDEDEKTAFHLAAMCEEESDARRIFSLLRETPGNVENIVAKDRRGRTVLHEAALKGHEGLCVDLLDLNSELIYIKDRDGRNPLYDAVKGEYKGTALYKQFLAAYLERDNPEDDLMDRSGLSPLHEAASKGKARVVEELLSSDEIKIKYLSRGDILAQTALHKAVKCGAKETVRILLGHGAQPLRERDCDGRTALHYAVQAETKDKSQLAKMLFWQCDSDEEASLLFWASAAGLGTAEDLSKDDLDLSEDDPDLRALHNFLVDKKKGLKKDNLLKIAASLGDIEMTKELISRGYQIGDIRDLSWTGGLTNEKKQNVERVLNQIEKIKEQANDKPAISDSLGRLDYAQGLAALFLNPYIKPPIAVGITGSWGMGKSSLMVQTERILLTAAAQITLLQYSKSSSSGLPDIKPCELSRKGKRKLDYIYRQINCERFSRNIFVIMWDYIISKVKPISVEDIQEKLEKFLNQYDLKYLKVFKALAAMDSSSMSKNASRPKADPSAEENVPAILTVQYNAWKYKNDTEALAGIAVEITKELEGIMTQAQWLNTCWRNTWKKKKYTLWIEIFFPSLLALVLVSSFTWIAWVLLDSDKMKEWGKTIYAWPPAAVVIIVWTLTKSIMGILNPVSTQLMQYISFPDHADKLGYQERVISDISFLRDEIGQKPYWLFIVFAWVLTTFKVLWGLITESCITSLLFYHKSHEKAIEAPKVVPASSSNLRIIVFVDDLDRCAESVILQVLSAVNLVLAVCEISVVMGMDKRLIERAIIKKYKDIKANESLKDKQELADMYLQKIIQLPLDLPKPSDEESKRFLRGQLGVLQNENIASTKDDRSSSSDAGEREAVQQNIAAQLEMNMPELEITETDDRGSCSGAGETETIQQNTAPHFEINVQSASEITETGPTNLLEPIEPNETRRQATSQIDTVTSIQQNLTSPILIREKHREKKKPKGITQKLTSSILIREMLFVRYSQGEERAFLYFQGLATDCRKLPREWKRLLNYHRLVWYIFSVSKEAKRLAGWQVQLITWIFVCWEWQDNMNIVIEKWKESGKKFLTCESNDPSLLMIVEHLIKEHERETPKMTKTSKGEDGPKSTQKLVEAGSSVAEIANREETESGRTELEKLDEYGESRILKITNGEHIATITDDIEKMENTTQKIVNDMKKKLDTLEKSLTEFKREMKELQEQVSDDLKKDIKELKKQLSYELKEDIKEVKEQITRKESGKNEEKGNKKRRELHENWKRMKSTLEKYDVSMDGIQAFQRFRFYCIAGHLPRPSSRW